MIFIEEDYLQLDIEYNVSEDEFKFDGDIKEEHRSEIISSFLRMQIGEGSDESERNNLDVYEVSLRWHPDSDRFEASSNTGNKGLRDGLLLEAINRLD